jgi:outer membrane lipoprotein carrier protein
MKKRSILCTLTSVGLMSYVVHAQEPALQDINNKQTNPKIVSVVASSLPLLSKEDTAGEKDKASLRSMLDQFTSYKSDFSQTIVDMQGQLLQSATGQVILQKPQQLRWSIESPDESLLIADGNNVYSVDPFLGQVTILEQAKLTQSNPLMLLISNDKEQWDEVVVEKIEAAQNLTTFAIMSSRKDSPISRLVLRFNAQNKLASLSSYDRQQQHNAITFTNVVLDAGVSKQDFTFAIDDSWIVDDQRSPSIN